MIQPNTPITIPDRVEVKLRDVRRTRDRTQLLRAVLIGLCALFVTMSIAMLIDWSFTLFDTFWRITLTGCSLATAAGTVFVLVTLGLTRRRDLAEVATDVDQSVPNTEERWSTVAELAAAPLDEQRRIHTGMLDRLSSEASRLDPQVVPQKVVSRNGLYWSGVGLGGLVLLLLLACLIDWQQTSVLVQRFWAPTADISVTQIDIADQQGVTARGEPLIIQATMHGRLVDEATLSLQHDGHDEAKQVAVAASGTQADQLVHRVKAADEDLRIRFRAGDGQTAWHTISVVDRPEIVGVRFRAVPPAWTNADPIEFNELPRKAAIVEGSRLEVEILPRDTVDEVIFQLNEEDLSPLSSVDGRWYRFHTTLENDLTLRAILRESHGLENKHPPVCRIRVYPDQAPSVSIVSPTEEMAARPDDVLDIEFTASDDFGIARAELVIYDEETSDGPPEERLVIEIPLDGQQNATEVNGSIPLDLAQLNLEDGKTLNYAVRVYDNHQSAASSAAPGTPTDASPESPAPAAGSADGRQMAAQDPQQSDASPAPSTATAATSSTPGATPAANSQRSPGTDFARSAASSSQPSDSNRADVAARDNTIDASDTPASTGTTPSTATSSASADTSSSDTSAAGSATPADATDNDSEVAARSPSSSASNGDPSGSSSSSSPGSSSSSSSPADSSENRPEITGASPPPVRMTPSALDSAQSASSGMMKLNIDKWSGSFASQQRRRVEMMISPALRKLDELLKKTDEQLRESLDQIESGEDWAGPQTRLLSSADRQLSDAIQLIMTVREKSADTLYTFIGLQLSEIADTHLFPAKDQLRSGRKAASNEERQPPLQVAWQQVSRARQRLQELNGQFERVRREHALADAVEQVRNMYLVFVEGSFELMSRDQQEINDYQRRIAEFEVDEEYLERLREVLEMRQKLVAEFARILSEDPRLLRRFVDSISSQSETLRDQLTLLTDRQKAIGVQVASWQKLDPQVRTAALAGLLRNKLRESQDIAQAAAVLLEDFDTWSPLTPNNSEADLNKARAALAMVAAAARELENSAAAWRVPDPPETTDGDEPPSPLASLPPLDDVSQRGQQLADRLQQFDSRLMDLSVGKEGGNAGAFFVRRLADVRRLTTRTSAWMYQLEQLEQANFHLSASADQHDIALKTNELTANLANLEQRIAGVLQRNDESLPADIASLSRQLLATLDERVAPSQLGAVFSLRQNDLTTAVTRAETAARRMEEAERLFDELIKRTIEEADKLPVQDPIAALLDDPTLDELLALLETESIEDLAAALGIPPRPTNLQTVGGFMVNRPSDGGMLTMSALSGPLQSLQGAGRRAVNRAREEINKQELRNNMRLDDWNVLASQLEDRLRQGQGQLPPERYRRAIEQYFEELSRRSAASQENSP